MNILTTPRRLSISRTGTIQGGPRLAKSLRDNQEEWDENFPTKPHLRNQQPRKRRNRALRWLL